METKQKMTESAPAGSEQKAKLAVLHYFSLGSRSDPGARRCCGRSSSSSKRIRCAAPSRSSNCPDRNAHRNAPRPIRPRSSASGIRYNKMVTISPSPRLHRRSLPSLKALRMTTIEDADMAMAATSGITSPATASGMVRML